MPNLHQKLDIKVINFVQHIYCIIISRESQFTKSLEVSKNMLNRGPLFANLQKLPNFGCIDETIILLHKFCNWFSDVDRPAGGGGAVKWRAASSLSQFWLMWAGWGLHHLHHGHGHLRWLSRALGAYVPERVAVLMQCNIFQPKILVECSLGPCGPPPACTTCTWHNLPLTLRHSIHA